MSLNPDAERGQLGFYTDEYNDDGRIETVRVWSSVPRFGFQLALAGDLSGDRLLADAFDAIAPFGGPRI